MFKNFNIRNNIDKVIGKLDAFNHEVNYNALPIALNDTARQGKQAGSEKAREKYNIQAGRLNKAVDLRFAKKGQPMAAVMATGNTPGLQNYGAREIRTVGADLIKTWAGGGGFRASKVRRGQKGVTVEIIRGRRKLVLGGFMAFPNRGVGVFRRKGQARLPIKRLFGPSAAGMFKQPEVGDAVMNTYRDRFETNLMRQIQRAKYKAGLR